MKKKTGFVLLMILAFAAFSVAASDPSGVVYWPASQLQGYSKTLAPKINEKKVASEQLGKFGNHSFMVAHREGNGEAELHQAQADVFFVQSGQATLVVGGEVVDGKNTAPNEVRGPSIRGGEQKKLSAGDVVHIPAKIPHQLLVEPGKQFTYFVVKIDTP